MKVKLAEKAGSNTVIRLATQEEAKTVKDFTGKKNELALRYEGALTVMYAGLGERADAEGARSAAGFAVKKCLELKRDELSLTGSLAGASDAHRVALAALEGALLATYSYSEHKSEKPQRLKALEIVLPALGKADLARCEAVCAGVWAARDLVNGNAEDVNPVTLAAWAQKLAVRFPSLSCTVLTEKDMKKEKMGLLLAVGRASPTQPRLIGLLYRGKPSSARLTALVGKGVTFDSGGYNFKPTGSIENMRDDMAGAAAVLGTMQALAESKAPVNVVAVVPAAHNALQGDAFFAGDVYRSYSGKTVEIQSTDAEGRLVLADAITWCQKVYKPTEIVDIATLTGSILASFGDLMAGLFSNDPALAARLSAAAAASDEALWLMPLPQAVSESLKSDLADLRNLSKLPKGHAGAIAGAAFIKEFVEGKTPWAHLDIAGMAYNTREDRGHTGKYATGYGVRLLYEFLTSGDEGGLKPGGKAKG